MSITIEYFAPSEALRDVVTFHYVLRSTVPRHAEPLSALLGQLIWVLEGGARYDFVGGRAALQPCSLVGPMNAGVGLEMDGPAVSVGCGLFPLGWSMLVRAGAAALADSIVDSRLVLGPSAGRLWQRLQETPIDAAKADLLDGYLRRRLVDTAAERPWRVAATDAWLVGTERDSAVLADTLGVSRRQAARVALDSHGANPRLLALKYRTLRAAAALATGRGMRWTEVAEAEFADQSHFIRDFHRFVGTTPGAFVQGRAALMREATRQRWRSGVRNPLALWS